MSFGQIIGFANPLAGLNTLLNTGNIGNAIGQTIGFDATPGNVKNPLYSAGTTAKPVAAPQTQITPISGIYNPGGAAGGSGGASSGSRIASAPAYDPAATQYYDDQIGKANSALGRLDAQTNVGLANIGGAYQSALNTLLGNNAKAERDYATTKQNTIDDNVAARAKVDSNVARQSQSLQRLLGNSSSAALFAAPLAVARQGSEQQNNIGTSFTRNLGALTTADEDRKKDFENAQGDLNTQRQTNENSLRAGIEGNRASILEQLQGLATQKAQAQGQNYAQARAAGAGYGSRVDSILNSITELGRNPSIAARNVSFTAPDLSAYTSQDIAAALGGNPAAAQAGQYNNLLNLSDDERKRNLL